MKQLELELTYEEFIAACAVLRLPAPVHFLSDRLTDEAQLRSVVEIGRRSLLTRKLLTEVEGAYSLHQFLSDACRLVCGAGSSVGVVRRSPSTVGVARVYSDGTSVAAVRISQPGILKVRLVEGSSLREVVESMVDLVGTSDTPTIDDAIELDMSGIEGLDLTKLAGLEQGPAAALLEKLREVNSDISDKVGEEWTAFAVSPLVAAAVDADSTTGQVVWLRTSAGGNLRYRVGDASKLTIEGVSSDSLRSELASLTA